MQKCNEGEKVECVFLVVLREEFLIRLAWTEKLVHLKKGKKTMREFELEYSTIRMLGYLR